MKVSLKNLNLVNIDDPILTCSRSFKSFFFTLLLPVIYLFHNFNVMAYQLQTSVTVELFINFFMALGFKEQFQIGQEKELFVCF